ncbi:MAG: FAD-dependent oxidoreductase, partial [Clostridia bacterium]|nr:FAD-dependent oxidoreductase [Clostridia bacterium]
MLQAKMLRVIAMFRINNIRFEIDEKFSKEAICSKLNIEKSDLKSFKILKKSVDARKKSDIHYVYSITAELNNGYRYESRSNFQRFEEEYYNFEYKTQNVKNPIIVGSGPAGLFAAYCLAMAGTEPIVLERGSEIDKRIKAVENFWTGGEFRSDTNVQFGEGGAGTFSDGKLTTGINDKRLYFIKDRFVKFGAPEEILYSAKPHIGTDKLIAVVKNMRNEIIALGGRFEFDTKLEEIIEENGKIKGAVIKKNNTKSETLCDNIILATGHSARDTFEMLKSKGVKMQRKTFSIGARIEHLQSDIGFSQYGDLYKKLPPADYK